MTRRQLLGRRHGVRPGLVAVMAVAGAVLAGACTSSGSSDGGSAIGVGDSSAVTTTRPRPPGVERMVAAAWPWRNRGGNRMMEGRGALDRAEPIDVALPGIPVLVLPARGWADGLGAMPGSAPEEPAPSEPAPRWYVELESGEGVVIDENLELVTGVVAEPAPATEAFDDPLLDGVQVQLAPYEVALVGPTDRYPHGALGDRIEASAVEILGVPTVDRVRFGPEPPTVIEGLSALLGDATGDGRPEVLVTESNAEVGARLTLWTPTGELVAESDPIGQGNRWRHQLAIAPVGPRGEIEIVEVRTPHLGGVVQYLRVVGDRLELVAALPGFTSHRLGSRNMDEAMVVDADGDGTLDVVLPTQDRDALAIVTRTADGGDAAAGVEVRAEVPLPGRMTTNLAAAPAPSAPAPSGPDTDGRERGLAFAVGTDQAVLRIWAAPQA